MRKGILLFSLFVMVSEPVMAANYIPKQFANTNTGEGLYPYSLNNRRQQKQTQNNNVAPIGGGTAPMQSAGKRGVIQRPVRARAATTANNTAISTNASITPRRVVQRQNVGRSATNNSVASYNTSTTRNTGNRGVVARGATLTGNVRTTSARRIATNTSTGTVTSSHKCFANYKECMETYCQREDTAYNRCFCSAKLAQIDSRYQKKIDTLIQEIITLKNSAIKDDPDDPLSTVEDYWDETVMKYTNDNSWDKLNASLEAVSDNLNWADTETRIRGQNAFNIGHEYCVNYLHSCAYMATNLRDAYKSEINRDCAAYEETLQRIQNVAESVIENYK